MAHDHQDGGASPPTAILFKMEYERLCHSCNGKGIQQGKSRTGKCLYCKGTGLRTVVISYI